MTISKLDPPVHPIDYRWPTKQEAFMEMNSWMGQKNLSRKTPKPPLITSIRSALERHQYRLTLERHQQMLQASEDRFRSVIAKNADCILVVDGQGEVRFANFAAEVLFGCQAEELIGQEFFGVLVEERPQCELNTEILAGVNAPPTAETRVVQTEVAILSSHRSGVVAEMRIVETEWEGQIAYLASLRDITERKWAEEALRRSEARLREQAQQLEQALHELKFTQAQLIQTEKMSSLGQLVAGVAHEINNPVNFIHGNLPYIDDYLQSILGLLALYQRTYPHPTAEIEAETAAVDLEFLTDDLSKILTSMRIGTDRIRQIVLSLRNFSRLNESEVKPVNIHEGIESTLLILQNRLKPTSHRPGIRLVQEYADLPLVECCAGALNQVFMNILSNAIDALDENEDYPWEPEQLEAVAPYIKISTAIKDEQWIQIRIADNGSGIPLEVQKRLFDPFFTTKPVGKGTGLGLSISYQIVVEKHGGNLTCTSTPGQGTEFLIDIPVMRLPANQKPEEVTCEG